MGEQIGFGTMTGYLAGDGRGGVVVVHEWDGLVPHIRDVADRVAALGFTALAPDLYDGASAPWGDSSEAERLQGTILGDPDGAANRVALAVGELRGRGHPKVTTLGFCTGAALSLLTSALHPVDATIAYYGIFPRRGERSITNPVLVHVAEHEEHNPPASPEQFPSWFEGMNNVEIHIYPGTRHAFFNDTYPASYDPAAASLSWERTVAFLSRHLAT
jgi:carboxymethylenebutenolidase